MNLTKILEHLERFFTTVFAHPDIAGYFFAITIVINVIFYAKLKLSYKKRLTRFANTILALHSIEKEHLNYSSESDFISKKRIRSIAFGESGYKVEVYPSQAKKYAKK